MTISLPSSMQSRKVGECLTISRRHLPYRIILTTVHSSVVSRKHRASLYSFDRLDLQRLKWNLSLPIRAGGNLMDYYGHIQFPCHGSRHGNRRTRYHEPSSTQRTSPL